ncbi:MAG: hypothetical protein M1822_009882 [Bathelium mastoideum]|nr:MAG: hypothetical protein M1822_009882 [Bathelium mastoideum]
MGAEQSMALRSMGQVDGKPVEFKYIREENWADDTSKQGLSYRLEDTNVVTTISGSDIIAILPVNIHLPKDYTLLYVKPPQKDASSEAVSKKSKGVTTFQSLVATNPPQQFVHDYAPGGQSCWQLRIDEAGRSAWPNLHIVISTKSGTGNADAHFQHLLKPLLAHLGQHEGSGYEIHRTESERSITELVVSTILPRARKGIQQAILLLSGDGGVVDLINALFTRGGQARVTSVDFGPTYEKPNICLLPMGTGNALANSIGLLRDHTLGLSYMLRGVHRSLPIFRAAFSPGARLVTAFGTQEEALPIDEHHTNVLWGAVVCSWGLHASLVADSDTEDYRQYGAERFQMAAKEALFPADGSEPHRYRGKVSVLRKSRHEATGVPTHDRETQPESKDELAWETLNGEEHAYTLATLVSNLEEGFMISPNAKPMDGRLWLVHFGPLDGKKIMEIMGLAYQGGKHVEDSAVGYEEIEALRIHFDGRESESKWRRVCIDGKIVRVESNGWVELRKERMDVVDLVGMA